MEDQIFKINASFNEWQNDNPLKLPLGRSLLHLEDSGGRQTNGAHKTHSRSVVGGPRRTEFAVDVCLNLARVVPLVFWDWRVRPPPVLDLFTDEEDRWIHRPNEPLINWSVGRSVGRFIRLLHRNREQKYIRPLLMLLPPLLPLPL